MKNSLRLFSLLLLVIVGSATITYSQTTPSTTDGKTADKPTTTTTDPKTKTVESIEGVWELDIEAQGQTYKAKLKIKKENNELKGDLTSDAGEGKFEKAMFKDNNFEVTFPFSFYGQPLQLTLKGTIDKDKIKGTLTPESQDVGDLPFTGIRKKE